MFVHVHVHLLFSEKRLFVGLAIGTREEGHVVMVLLQMLHNCRQRWGVYTALMALVCAHHSLVPHCYVISIDLGKTFTRAG